MAPLWEGSLTARAASVRAAPPGGGRVGRAGFLGRSRALREALAGRAEERGVGVGDAWARGRPSPGAGPAALSVLVPADGPQEGRASRRVPAPPDARGCRPCLRESGLTRRLTRRPAEPFARGSGRPACARRAPRRHGGPGPPAPLGHPRARGGPPGGPAERAPRRRRRGREGRVQTAAQAQRRQSLQGVL